MMHGSRLRLAAATAVAVLMTAVPASQAGIINGSFETGDFTGWQVVQPPFASVVTSAAVSLAPAGPGSSSNPPPWAPTHGKHFAYLSAGAAAGRYTLLSQAFAGNAGDVVSFDIFFDGGDYLPYNDNGFANVLNLDTLDLDNVYMKDIASVGDYGEDGWRTVSYTIPGNGNYRLLFGVNNDGDNKGPSFLGVDNLIVRGSGEPVPEPSTILIWALAGAGLFARSRRRTAA
jgi:hypothetical protein